MKNLSQMYKTKSPFSVLKQKLNYMSSCFNYQYEGLLAALLRPCVTAYTPPLQTETSSSVVYEENAPPP